MLLFIIKYYVDGGIEKILTFGKNVNSYNTGRKLDGRAEAKMIKIACSFAPEGHSRWTLRLLEDKANIELEVPVSKDTID